MNTPIRQAISQRLFMLALNTQKPQQTYAALVRSRALVVKLASMSPCHITGWHYVKSTATTVHSLAYKVARSEQRLMS